MTGQAPTDSLSQLPALVFTSLSELILFHESQPCIIFPPGNHEQEMLLHYWTYSGVENYQLLQR